jgi:hypothetical protein
MSFPMFSQHIHFTNTTENACKQFSMQYDFADNFFLPSVSASQPPLLDAGFQIKFCNEC